MLRVREGLFLLKSIVVLVVCAGVVGWAAPLHPSSTHLNSDLPLHEFVNYWEARIPRLLEDLRIPGAAVALVVAGEPVWYGYYGLADQDAGIAVGEETLFQVGSIAKSVTSWGVLTLVDTGQVQLDRPIAQYWSTWSWPATGQTTSSITTRQLLSHTAGLGLGAIDQRYVPGDPNIPDLRTALTADVQSKAAPGQSFSYSNTGFNVLEILVEDVTGRDFADFMQAEVLNPLGMEGASFGLSPARAQQLARGYDSRHESVGAYVYPESASGGLFATVEDIARFTAAGSAQAANRPWRWLQRESLEQLYEPQAPIPGVYGMVFSHYGLGHFLEYLGDSQLAVSHGGQGYGWMNHFHLVPETGEGVVILTNSQRSWPLFAHLLTDWSRWLGYESIGMGVLLTAQTVVWIVVGLLLGLLVWGTASLLADLRGRHRKWFWRLRTYPLVWWLRVSFAVLVLLGLLWANNQPYLLMTAILPTASHWLAVVLLGWVTLLLVESLLPKTKMPRASAAADE